MSEQYAMAARLYAEAVALFTAGPATTSLQQYDRRREAVEDACRRARSAGLAFDEHLGLHSKEAKSTVA